MSFLILITCSFTIWPFPLQGIQYLCSLQELNLYYNNIPSLVEVSRLQPLPFLKELDLRLNPVVRKDTDYRLFAVYTLQTLEKLGETLFLFSSFQNLPFNRLSPNLLEVGPECALAGYICLLVNIYVTLLCWQDVWPVLLLFIEWPSMILSVTSSFSFF